MTPFCILGLELISSDEIFVYGKNPTNGTSDVYRILPVIDIGDEYIVISHRQPGNVTSHIGIVSTSPNTEVIVSVPKLQRHVHMRFGKHYVQEGQKFKLGLNVLETIQLDSTQDLTGVRIVANYPVAVMIGETSERKSRDGTVLLDHFESQLIPTKHWQNSYVAVPHSIGDYDDVFHIIGKYSVCHFRFFPVDTLFLYTSFVMIYPMIYYLEFTVNNE